MFKLKKIVIIIALFLLIGSLVFYYIKKNINDNNREEPEQLTFLPETKNEEKDEKEVISIKYFVDIKGAINKPNVYEVNEGSRIIDVITLAGGLKKDADTSLLNLSKKITDEMVIIIYTKYEVRKFKNKTVNHSITETKEEANKEGECPDPIINEACICDNNNETSNNSKVSINKATLSELQTLPGIGEAKATDIIDYRNNNGLFININDIKKVNGIGDSIFDKIKDYITV